MEALWFVLSVIAGLLILVFLVVVHELGHGIVARRNGVAVDARVRPFRTLFSAKMSSTP